MGAAIARAAADLDEEVGGVEQLALLGQGERAFEGQHRRRAQGREVGEWRAKGERLLAVDPAGEGFQMREDAVDGRVRPAARAVLVQRRAQRIDEGAREPRGPGRALAVAEFVLHEGEEAADVAALDRAGTFGGGDGELEVGLQPGFEIVAGGTFRRGRNR